MIIQHPDILWQESSKHFDRCKELIDRIKQNIGEKRLIKYEIEDINKEIESHTILLKKCKRRKDTERVTICQDFLSEKTTVLSGLNVKNNVLSKKLHNDFLEAKFLYVTFSDAINTIEKSPHSEVKKFRLQMLNTLIENLKNIMEEKI